MVSVAPYGYRKDPKDKNHLIVDKEVVPVIRKYLADKKWLSATNYKS